jgi:putative tryptophan/tyrosine transport system substrate-binding protein
VAGSLESTAPNLEAFRQGLREFGYVDGQNMAIQVRAADGWEDRLPALASELVQNNVDVIVTSGTAPIRAATRATTTIPIVFANAADPVADGFVVSLARPGRNVTGVTMSAGDENAKRFEMLKQAAPSIRRTAVLWNQSVARGFRQTEDAARILGVGVESLELRGPGDLDSVLSGAIDGHADSLFVVATASMVLLAPQIVEFAARNRLPAMYTTSAFALAGGLMTHSPSVDENFRHTATFVDKILKGANPAELPVERPTRYEFVINLRAAEQLGLTLPDDLLIQATELIR